MTPVEDKDLTEFALQILNHPERRNNPDVVEWLSHKENQKLYEELRRYSEAALWVDRQSIPDVEVAYRHFCASRHQKKIHRMQRWATVAAMLVLAFSAGWFWLRGGIAGSRQDKVIEQMVQNKPVIQPGRTQAVLIAENGEEMMLGGKDLKNVEMEKGVKVSYDSAKGINYQVAAASAVHYHTLQIPKGGEYRLALADGTVVWLNSESILRYPTGFTGNTREVELKGEAYFSVAKNPDMPFIVHAQGVDTRVYGTEFNVKSYSGEEANVTLVKGSVSVRGKGEKREYMLKPGENAFMSGKGPVITPVNVHRYIAWKEGYFYYENETLQTILKELGRWYDFDVAYVGDRVRNLRFELWTNRNSDIDSVVALLTQTNKLSIRVERETLIVSEITR